VNRVDPLRPPASFPPLWLVHPELAPIDSEPAGAPGGWSVVQHLRKPGIHTIVAVWGPAIAGGDALLPCELRAAVRRAQGDSIKAIGFEEGWSTGTATKRIQSARRKLRLRSEAELVAFFADARAGLDEDRPDACPAWAPPGSKAQRVMYRGEPCLVLNYPAPEWRLPACLTGAEGRVVHALIEGSTHRAIARLLGVSCRTVAVHLNAVYRKLSVHGRIELFAALRAPGGRGIT
jgi:DNA-binding NarL/FixJ family response regulator